MKRPATQPSNVSGDFETASDDTQHICAIIPAAGFSSRMNAFKPLLRIGESSFLERTVQLFQDAGIQDIRVVTGHRHEDVLSLYGHLAVDWRFNPDFETGMFSSILAGVKDLPSQCRAFFVLPVDIPLVRPSTLRALMKTFYETGRPIVHPCFRGRRGHPPLISGSLLPNIKRWRGKDGLRGFLAQYDTDAVDIETGDEAILLDADTKAAYELLVQRHRLGAVPSLEECMVLLTEKFKVEKPIIDHSLMVARTACALGTRLNRSGYRLDLHLIEATALLHDIARHQPNHAHAGADILEELGFTEVSEIVRFHMDLNQRPEGPVTEKEIVFLADKLVQKDRPVSLEARFAEKIKRYAADPPARQAAMDRFEQAMAVKQRWESATGKSIASLLADPSLRENEL